MSDFVPVSSGAVIYIKNERCRITSTALLRPVDLIEEIGQKIAVEVPHPENKRLFSETGIICQILEPGGDWKQGQLRFRLEFATDETTIKS